MARRSRRRALRRGRLLALGVVVVLGLLYYRPVQSYLETRSTLAERRAEVQALEQHKQALQERLREAESGVTLVRRARRLGLVKPGERLFIVRGIPEWRRARTRRN